MKRTVDQVSAIDLGAAFGGSAPAPAAAKSGGGVDLGAAFGGSAPAPAAAKSGGGVDLGAAFGGSAPAPAPASAPAESPAVNPASKIEKPKFDPPTSQAGKKPTVVYKMPREGERIPRSKGVLRSLVCTSHDILD